jgi:hypothetical protein
MFVTGIGWGRCGFAKQTANPASWLMRRVFWITASGVPSIAWMLCGSAMSRWVPIALFAIMVVMLFNVATGFIEEKHKEHQKEWEKSVREGCPTTN